MKFNLTIIVAVASVLATVVLYEPASLLIYRVREPYFGYPIKTNGKGIVIRNDGAGDGAFGSKRRSGHSHSGIDIQANIGMSVYASKSGIAFRGNVPTGYGKYVMIYHPDGFITMYSHLSDWSVISGRVVTKGELIGFVGKTGNAQGRAVQPHLHFEIKKDGVAYDPMSMMR